MAIAASVGTILIGAYSFVYACNESRSKDTAKNGEAKQTTWYAADASTTPKSAFAIDTKVVCETVQSMAPIAIEVEVPAEAFQIARVVHIRGTALKHSVDETTSSVEAVKRAAKVAMTLGRAFVTTVGAVFGSLVDAAVDATSSLV